jgi:type IV secretory pathway VirB9-like protein
MVDNSDFLSAIDTNPYRFQDFGIRTYAMFVNGRQVPNETLTFVTGHEKTSAMAYKTI